MVVAGVLEGRTERSARVDLPGGPLQVTSHTTHTTTICLNVLAAWRCHADPGSCQHARSVASLQCTSLCERSACPAHGCWMASSQIEWREADGHVYMTGPAELVFSGSFSLP